MNKALRISIWVISSIITISVICFISFYLWMSSKWSEQYSEDEMNNISAQIDSSKEFPKNFYTAYETIYPNQINKSIFKMSIQSSWYLVTNNKTQLREVKPCNCIKASKLLKHLPRITHTSWNNYIIGSGIEEYSSEKKCLDFIYQQLNIDSISMEYFSKEIHDLSLNETIELIIWSDKHYVYKKRPDLFKQELEKHIK